MVDNLLLYKGPSRESDLKTNIVTMNETPDQLRFDIIHRTDEGVQYERIIFQDKEGRMVVKSGIHKNVDWLEIEPMNYFNMLSNLILDTSAHKVYRKAIFRFLRRYVEVDSFRTLVSPEQSILKAMYPVTRQIPLYSVHTLTTIKNSGYKEYIQSFRQPDVQHMAKKLFGQKRYRKDLVKALAGANSVEFLAFMLTLKREIPVDWFISILRNNPTLTSLPAEYNPQTLARFYDAMSDKQFRKFCRCLMEEDFVPLQSILDTAEQFFECLDDEHNEIDPVTTIKFRSIEEFHYMVGKYHENTAKERERREMIKKHGGELKGNDWYEQIKSLDFEDAPYEVVVPKYAYELVEWGKQMNNCIGGYASRAKDSDVDAYIALKDKKSGTMKANILISNRNVRQFFAKRNSNVDPQIAFDFNLRLILGGIITEPQQLFGQHFQQISNTTGNNNLESILDEYRQLGVGMNDYIELRKNNG